MTTTRSTKSALVSATLVLVLCVSALLGTTFAWFTDSVTSGNNIIQSGNLDIGLKYAKIEDGAITGWSDVDDTVKVFDPNALWEPGRVEVVYLEVANLGTLALKYKLGVNIIDEDAGTNVAGEEFKLSDHLVFSVVPFDAEPTTAYSREEAIAAAGDSKGLTDYNGATTALEVNGLDYVALIVYRPESVGNEANYREDDMPTIELGVNLYATQQAAENDSFGPDYDKDAVYTEKTYAVDSTGTLAGTLAEINSATEESVLVQLAAPMSWETGAGHGSNPWVDENAAVKELIIDANGNTITATGAGVGPIRMANGGTLVIKNAKIVDESVSYAEGSWEFGYLEFQGNVVFENVEFVNAVMVEGDSAIFTNCTFNSNKDNEYGVWVANGDATFTGCTFAGPRGLKTHEDYGTEVGTILVDNCTFDNISKKPGVAIGDVNADTTITIKNSDFINCQAGDQGLFIYETDTDVATFNFTCSDNEVIKVVTPDLVITTKEELFAFANEVNVNGNGFAGKLVVLGADIDLENAEWTPIGQTGGNGVATYFQGMFDGKGYTIKNLKVTDNAYDEGKNYAAGLFGFIDAGDAQIVNLTVDGAEVNGHHWTGVIAGYLSGKISNCTVKNAIVNCTHANDDACGDKAGVIVGYVNQGVVTNNNAQNSTVTAGRDAGQIAGAAKADYVYGNTATNVTVTAGDDCTGANIRNEQIGRVL